MSSKLLEEFFERVAIRVHDGGQSENNAIWGAWNEVKHLKPQGGWPVEIQHAVRSALAALQSEQAKAPEPVKEQVKPVVVAGEKPKTAPVQQKPAAPKAEPKPKSDGGAFPW